MAKFIIRGGNRLVGEITVNGSKNDATPAVCATLLTSEPVLLRNVPRISDVLHLLEILTGLGAEVSWQGAHDIRISCAHVNPGALDRGLVASMRSSALLMGPMLARFGAVELPEPGGDVIGKRPLETHFYAFEKLGATVERSHDRVRISGSLRAAEVILPELSVTATENAVMAASRITGTTVVKLAATEPHVQNLCRMLIAMGARIEGIGSHTLRVTGAAALRGADHTIIPDTLEVGTMLVAIAATKGEATIVNVVPEHLEMVLNLVSDIGIRTEYRDGRLRVLPPAGAPRPFRLLTLPYPGFPTDLQAPFSVLATQCDGMSMIHDPLYEGRLGYVHWLTKMGANAVVCDPHRVVFSGPTPLHGYEIKALDIRAGATLLIAGLTASGETVLHDAEIIDRGYEKLAERLGELGADIRREQGV